jgi:DNA repair photolyase
LTRRRTKSEYKGVEDVVFPSDSPPNQLVGIARLAAESELLEAKRRVQYLELPTRRFITRCSSPRVPFQWTINPYRGCEFGCKYCYARYTHEFMELWEGKDFEERIFAKEWSASAFRAELSKIPRDEAIAIGTATDPYQPAERRYGVTRKILEVFAGERGRKVSIISKSDLIARDSDLFKVIARRNRLLVHVTITTMDVALARLLEPYAPRPDLRMEAVQLLAAAGLQTGVMSAPILPLINDSEASLDAVAGEAKRAGAASYGGHVVFLKPCSQKVFFPFLEEEFPHLVRRYRERFERSAFLRGEYPDLIQRRIERVRQKHGLSRRFEEYQPEEWEGEEQLGFNFAL